MVEGRRTRMSRAERRRQLLQSALRVVADKGFTATTTADVAEAAGLSQPYVVRVFGGKAELLVALYDDVAEQVLDAFRAVSPGPRAQEEMGRAYVDLVADRDLLRVLLHGFSAAADPTIGARARATLARVHRLYAEVTGSDPEQARDFLARGMLITVLLAVEAPEHAEQEPDLEAVWRSCVSPPLPG